MITADDVAAVVKTLVAAQPNYATVLPGKVWFGRGPDAPDGYPYSVCRIEADEAQLTTGGPYVQAWTARFASYVQVGASGNDPAAVAELLNAALVGTAAQTAMLALALRNPTEKVIMSRPKPSESKYAPELRGGKDVFAGGLAVEIVFQGDRSVS